MAHNRTTSYSAPYRRNNLLGLHQYAASENFPSLGTWDRAKSDDMYVVRGTAGRSHPVSITVVGAISSDKASLQPHGNYNPSYTSLEDLPKKARLQFYLTCPADDPNFSSDYALSIKRLKTIQDDIAASPSRREHFIEGSNLKMNFLLFEEKEPAEDVDNKDVKKEPEQELEGGEEDESTPPPPPPPPPTVAPYEVVAPYQDAWDFVSKTHHNNIMEVYGVDELPVDYRRFHKVLVSGTTVVVAFVLKHYTIREKGGTAAASDTYTALVQSISVLKEVEKKSRRTSTPKRRPLPVPQLPSRGTLTLAANTFSPVRVGPTLAQSSSATSEQCRKPAPFDPSSDMSPAALSSTESSAAGPSARSVPSKETVASSFASLLLELANPASRYFNPALLATINQLSSHVVEQPSSPTPRQPSASQPGLPSASQQSSLSASVPTSSTVQPVAAVNDPSHITASPSSPSDSSSSTMSSASDRHSSPGSSPGDGEPVSWVDIQGSGSVSVDNRASDPASEYGNPPDLVTSELDDGFVELPVSAVSSSEDERAEGGDDGGTIRKKRKTAVSVSRKGKGKKTN